MVGEAVITTVQVRGSSWEWVVPSDDLEVVARRATSRSARDDILQALACYRRLVNMPERQRRMTIAAIRRARSRVVGGDQP